MRTLRAHLPAAAAAAFGCLLTAPVAFAADGENAKLNLDNEAGKAAETASGASGGRIVRTIFGLAVVLGVIYGLAGSSSRSKSEDSVEASESLEDDRDPEPRHEPLAAPRARRRRDRPAGRRRAPVHADPPLSEAEACSLGPARAAVDDAREPRGRGRAAQGLDQPRRARRWSVEPDGQNAVQLLLFLGGISLVRPSSARSRASPAS